MPTLAAQPTIRNRGITNLSLTRRLEARCMMTAISGAVSIPLRTAPKYKARMGSICRKFRRISATVAAGDRYVEFHRAPWLTFETHSPFAGFPNCITRRAGQHWYRKHAGTDNAAGK